MAHGAAAQAVAVAVLAEVWGFQHQEIRLPAGERAATEVRVVQLVQAQPAVLAQRPQVQAQLEPVALAAVVVRAAAAVVLATRQAALVAMEAPEQLEALA